MQPFWFLIYFSPSPRTVMPSCTHQHQHLPLISVTWTCSTTISPSALQGNGTLHLLCAGRDNWYKPEQGSLGIKISMQSLFNGLHLQSNHCHQGLSKHSSWDSTGPACLGKWKGAPHPGAGCFWFLCEMGCGGGRKGKVGRGEGEEVLWFLPL